MVVRPGLFRMVAVAVSEDPRGGTGGAKSETVLRWRFISHVLSALGSRLTKTS